MDYFKIYMFPQFHWQKRCKITTYLAYLKIMMIIRPNYNQYFFIVSK
jgi:hypothetical protein